MIGEDGLGQWISDDEWEEMRTEERYQDVMLANSMNDGRELGCWCLIYV